MSDPGKAVFLSYASQDTDAARRIAEALRAEGIEVWFDVSELRGGEAWDASIQKQIAECSVFVAIVSANTQSRREGYFRLEWRLADERMRLMAEGTPFVLPVIIDGTKERDALVPKSFLGVQWTWLPHGEVPPAFVARVQKLLGASEAALVAPGANPAVEVRRSHAPMSAPAQVPHPPSGIPWLRLLPWLTTVLLGAGMLWISLRPTTSINPPGESRLPTATRATILLPPEAPLAPTQAMPFGCPYNVLALSPDGATLVYVALVNGKRQLWRRPMDGRAAQSVPNTDEAYFPFFSPDSRWVAFFAEGKVKKVALAGGVSETLCDLKGETHEGIWNEDGYLYINGVFRVPERGGIREDLTGWDLKSGWLFNATALPGGQYLVCDLWPYDVSSGDFSMLELFSPATKLSHNLAARGHNPRILPPGYLVFARGSGLHAAAFDFDQRTIRSEAALVLDGVRTSAAWRVAQYTVSANGTLVYAAGGKLDHSTPAWVTRDGKVTKLPIAPGLYAEPALSPNGRRLAVEMPDAQDAIWIFDIETGRGGKMTEPGANRHPVWMSDSQRLIFASYRDEHWGIYMKDLTRGEQPAELVLRSDRPRLPLWPRACSPDSKSLVLVSVDKSGNWPHFVLPLTGDRTLRPLVLGPDSAFVDFSPDGRWIAFSSGKSGLVQTYIRRFPDGEEEQVSTELGGEPFWSSKGDELFYRNGDTWYSVAVAFEPSLRASPPRKLFSGAFYDAPGYSYATAPDAQRFLVFVPDPPDVPLTQLEVITNWTAEVARKVAAVNATRQKP